MGWDIVPDTPAQVWFTSAMVIVGLALFATLVGSASNAVRAFNAEADMQTERLKTLDAYLHKHHVPYETCVRVRSFLKYSWDVVTEKDNMDVLQALPRALQAELQYEVKAHYLELVPMFDLVYHEEMSDLLHAVHRRVFLPSEVIIEQGATGKTLFVLQRGSVAIERDGLHLCVLTDRSYFGERALFRGTKRTASVIATSYCEALYIVRDDLMLVADAHPGMFDRMRKSFEDKEVRVDKQGRRGSALNHSASEKKRRISERNVPTVSDLENAWTHVRRQPTAQVGDEIWSPASPKGALARNSSSAAAARPDPARQASAAVRQSDGPNETTVTAFIS